MYPQISLIPAVHLEVACDWDLSKPNMLIENIIYNLPTDTAGMPDIELLFHNGMADMAEAQAGAAATLVASSLDINHFGVNSQRDTYPVFLTILNVP